MESAQAYDQGVLYFFGSLNRPWLDPVVRAVALLGCPWTLAGVVVALAGLFAWLRRWRSAVVLVGIACGAAGLQLGVARFVDRTRPDVNWRTVDLPTSPGFPDGRALGAVAVYVGGGLLARRFIAVGAVVALLVGLSRPYLGVAYPVDVLAGWVGGLIVALVGSACAARIRPS
jgi:undecaprenyl-diphosphatase